MAKQVILYRAHHDDPAIRAELRKLAEELPDIDLVLVRFHEDAASEDRWFNPSFVNSAADIAALPYANKLQTFTMGHRRGHEDLPVMRYFRAHRDYDYYWVIEYDVRWSGHWRALFDELSSSRADLLATSVADYVADPGWSWWGSLHHNGQAFQKNHYIKAFLPFCRLSREALEAVDRAYETGTSGHYEVAWPSICAKNGLLVEDIGGNGPFTPEGRKGRLYSSTLNSVSLSPGTFVFRPSFDIEAYQAMLANNPHGPALWHPVKSVEAKSEQVNLASASSEIG